MPIQIPSVERFKQPEQQPSEGRVNVNTGNPLKTAGVLGDATMHFVESIGNEYAKAKLRPPIQFQLN